VFAIADDATTDEIADSAQSIVDTTLAALPRIGVALLIIAVAWGISRLVRWLLHTGLARRQTPSFARVMSRLGGWAVLAMGVLLATAVTFPSVEPVDLLAGLGIFSVAVGFAFQDILENTLAGVLLLFRQPFRSGDQIEVNDQTGTVEAISIRETRIRTFDGQLVLVPNRDVYKSVIRVQTHYPLRRMEFVVGVAYENDPARAIEVITSALADVDGVAGDPAPEALASELGSSTVDLDVRFWTDPRQHDALTTTSAAIVAVKAALDAAGIELPADIVVLQATPSFRAAVQGDAMPTPGGGVERPGTRG
jgi:small conductance mechanosensitive channel